MTQTKTLTERMELTTTHEGEERTFYLFGPGDYNDLGNQIEEAGMKRASMGEVILSAHEAFKENSRYSKEKQDKIKEILKQNWLYGFTESIALPNQDVIYAYDAPTKADEIDINSHDLERILRDNTEKRVSFGYKIGEQSFEEFRVNPYLILLAGEEGAEKATEIASKFRLNPYLWSPSKQKDKPLKTVSTLSSDWSLGHWLCVGGDDRGGRGGFALGYVVGKKIFNKSLNKTQQTFEKTPEEKLSKEERIKRAKEDVEEKNIKDIVERFRNIDLD